MDNNLRARVAFLKMQIASVFSCFYIKLSGCAELLCFAVLFLFGILLTRLLTRLLSVYAQQYALSTSIFY